MNLHAPWRAEYIRLLGGKQKGCFLCRSRNQGLRGRDNLVLWRSGRCLVVLNRFPYTGGHLLVAPLRHIGSLKRLPPEVMGEMMELARDAAEVLARALKAEGFNIGLNLGRCAGAGLPGHLHLHVVPRWSGDTNFMATLGDVRVIPQSLFQLRRQLLRAAAELNLPRAAHGRRPAQ
jgi:ATP adenylyltransferase